MIKVKHIQQVFFARLKTRKLRRVTRGHGSKGSQVFSIEMILTYNLVWSLDM